MRLAWGRVYQHCYREMHVLLDFQHTFFMHMRKHKKKNDFKLAHINRT